MISNNNMDIGTTGGSYGEGMVNPSGRIINTLNKTMNESPIGFNDFPGLGKRKGYFSNLQMTDNIGPFNDKNISLEYKEMRRRDNNLEQLTKAFTNTGDSFIYENLTMVNIPIPHPPLMSNNHAIRNTHIQSGEPVFCLMNIKDNMESMDNSYQIYNASMLNMMLEESNEYKNQLIINGLTVREEENYLDYTSAEKVQDAETSQCDYANTIEEFNKKIIFLGFFKTYDTPSVDKDFSFSNERFYDTVSSYQIEGPFNGLPNYFGITKNGGYYIGLILKKRNYFNLNEPILDQIDRPLRIDSWSSYKVKSPFVGSSQYVYSSMMGMIENSIMANISYENNNNIEDEDLNREIREVFKKNYTHTLHQMNLLHSDEPGHIEFLRDDNNAEERSFSNDRYRDLGFYDVKIKRDERDFICVRPNFDVGMFFKCGFVEMNELGKSVGNQKCDEALHDITGESFTNANNYGHIAATIFT